MSRRGLSLKQGGRRRVVGGGGVLCHVITTILTYTIITLTLIACRDHDDDGTPITRNTIATANSTGNVRNSIIIRIATSTAAVCSVAIGRRGRARNVNSIIYRRLPSAVITTGDCGISNVTNTAIADSTLGRTIGTTLADTKLSTSTFTITRADSTTIRGATRDLSYSIIVINTNNTNLATTTRTTRGKTGIVIIRGVPVINNGDLGTANNVGTTSAGCRRTLNVASDNISRFVRSAVGNNRRVGSHDLIAIVTRRDSSTIS